MSKKHKHEQVAPTDQTDDNGSGEGYETEMATETGQPAEEQSLVEGQAEESETVSDLIEEASAAGTGTPADAPTAEDATTPDAAPADGTASADAPAKKAANNKAREMLKGKAEVIAETTKIYPHAADATNHRQADSAGFAAMQIVLNDPGLTYKTYMERAVADPKLGSAAAAKMHLRWDIGHGRLYLVNEDGTEERYELKVPRARTVSEKVDAAAPTADNPADPAPATDKPKRGRKKKAAAEGASTEAPVLADPPAELVGVAPTATDESAPEEEAI